MKRYLNNDVFYSILRMAGEIEKSYDKRFYVDKSEPGGFEIWLNNMTDELKVDLENAIDDDFDYFDIDEDENEFKYIVYVSYYDINLFKLRELWNFEKVHNILLQHNFVEVDENLI